VSRFRQSATAARADRSRRPSGRGTRRAVTPRPRPRPRTGASKLEILECRPARVHGDCRRAAVDTKPAHELLCPVGGAEDAGGDDLLAAGALAHLLGERDQQVDAGADRQRQAEPNRAFRTGGERRLGSCASGQPSREGQMKTRIHHILATQRACRAPRQCNVLAGRFPRVTAAERHVRVSQTRSYSEIAGASGLTSVS